MAVKLDLTILARIRQGILHLPLVVIRAQVANNRFYAQSVAQSMDPIVQRSIQGVLGAILQSLYRLFGLLSCSARDFDLILRGATGASSHLEAHDFNSVAYSSDTGRRGLLAD